MDRDHRRLFAGGAAHDANNCELSGNHPKNMTSETFDSRGCTSPVARRRKYAPVLSEYARYLPSGDIAEAWIRFSAGFVVKRCNAVEACDNFDRDARRQKSHPATMPATRTMASTDPPTCHIRAQGLDNTFEAIRPVSASRFMPSRSDRPDGFAAGNSTLPIKRYPRRATVSTKMGLSADSPRASRNLLMAAFRL